MKVLSRVTSSLHLFEDAVLVLALLAMLSMALLQILMRNFFDSGFLWAESFLRVLVLWVAMLGAMVATRERNHINIDLISRFAKSHLMIWLRVLTHLFSALVCGVCAWHAVKFIQYEFEDGTIAFGLVPVWICQSIIPLGFGIMALRFLLALLPQEEQEPD